MSLTEAEVEAGFKELVRKFPRIERLPVDPPIAGQNTGLFSFKLLPKPVNGIYGFLKFRGAFATDTDWENHAKNIIRTVDSKHTLWPYPQGHWYPITTNEDYAKETLEVNEKDEIVDTYNNKETEENKEKSKQVRDIKRREQKLLEESKQKFTNKESLDYYATKVMMVQQLESWLNDVRKRKRDMIKALKGSQEEIERLNELKPEYKEQVVEKIKELKEGLGLDENTPLDKPSLS